MNQPSASDALRFLLIASLGLPLFACGSANEPATGDGDGDVAGDGDGDVGTGGSGVVDLSQVLSTCTNPTPFREGMDSGVYQCDEGYLHRAERVACPSVLPRDNEVVVPDYGYGGTGPQSECATDADCGDKGYCKVVDGGFEIPHTSCAASCVTDVDCSDGFVCLCGAEFGTCVPGAIREESGGCNTDADCADGELCVGVFENGSCGPGRYEFVCTPFDLSCSRWDDRTCEYGNRCSVDDSGRLGCQPDSVCGRPFPRRGARSQGGSRLASRLVFGRWLF